MLTPKQIRAALQSERIACNACDYHLTKLVQLGVFIEDLRALERKTVNYGFSTKIALLITEQYEEQEELILSSRAHLLNDTHPTQVQIEQEEEDV